MTMTSCMMHCKSNDFSRLQSQSVFNREKYRLFFNLQIEKLLEPCVLQFSSLKGEKITKEKKNKADCSFDFACDINVVALKQMID